MLTSEIQSPSIQPDFVYRFPIEPLPDINLSLPEYLNRSTFLESVHVEMAGQDSRCNFQVTTINSEDWPYSGLRFNVDAVGPLLRLCFSFSLSNCAPGDIVHLRWLARVSASPNEEEASEIRTFLLSSDLSKGGKSILGAGRDERGNTSHTAQEGWSERHVLFQVVDPTIEGFGHLAFGISAPGTLEVAGVVASVCANRPLPASVMAKAQGNTRPQVSILSSCTSLPAIAGAVGTPVLEVPPEFGFVQKAGPRGVEGLAWNASDPASSAPLECLVDGKVVSVFLAESLAPTDEPADTSAARFVHPAPLVLLDGNEHEINIRFSDSGRSLQNCPFRLKIEPSVEGLFRINDAGQLSGWAIDRAFPSESVTIEIFLDGIMLTEVQANLPHGILAGRAYNEGRCAFVVPLPNSIKDGERHTLEARVKGGGTLPGSPITVQARHERYLLQLDPIQSDRRISGWVVDLQAASPITMEVHVDQKLFGAIRADKPRAVKESSDPSVNRRGFSFGIPPYATLVEFRIANATLAAFDIAYAPDGTATALPAAEMMSDKATAESTEQPATEALFDCKAALAKFHATPDKFVDAEWYLAMYPSAETDLASKKVPSAAEHWLQIGARMGYSPNAWFDENWYLLQYPDVREAIDRGDIPAGYIHWLAAGAAEWRKPGPGFDPHAYRQANRSLEKTLLGADAYGAVRHWLAFDRSSKPWLDVDVAAPDEPSPAPTTKASTNMRRKILSQMLTPQRHQADFFVQTDRLVKDLSSVDTAKAEGLRDRLAENEIHILESILSNPVIGEPLVSVIMPTYNRGFLIAEGIQSVIDQAWKNWELIICDDGSTDKTSFVVNEFQDPRIRYLPLEKANGAVARNFGMKFALGDYVAFLDSDNLWHPQFLNLSVGVLQRATTPIAYSGYIDTSMSRARFSDASLKFREFDYQALLSRNYIDLNTIVLKRVVYEQLGGFDEELGRVQDWDLVLKYTRLADPLQLHFFTTFYRRNIAWGQVTDLHAHTDYNAIVRDRALQRLNDGIQSFQATSPARRVISLAAGTDGAFSREMLLLAELLKEAFEVKVLVPDSSAARQFLVQNKLCEGVRIGWLTAGSYGKQLLGHVTGEALLCFDSDSLQLGTTASVAGIKRIDLMRDKELLKIGLHGQPHEAALIVGALQFCDPEAPNDPVEILETFGVSAKNGLFVVLCPFLDRKQWHQAVRAKKALKASVLLVSRSASDGLVVATYENGLERQIQMSEKDLLSCTSKASIVVLSTSGSDASLDAITLGTAAMAAGGSIVVDGGALFSSWLETRCVHQSDMGDAGKVLDHAARILADTAGIAKMTARAKRRFQHMYRWSAMRERVMLALDIILDHDEGRAAR